MKSDPKMSPCAELARSGRGMPVDRRGRRRAPTVAIGAICLGIAGLAGGCGSAAAPGSPGGPNDGAASGSGGGSDGGSATGSGSGGATGSGNGGAIGSDGGGAIGPGSGGATGRGSGGATGSGGVVAVTGSGGATAGSGGGAAGGAGATDACGRPSAIAIPSGYSMLAWHDEFDVDGTPSAANWGYETGFVRNEEAQWYQAQNANVSNGMLIITAKKETKANPNYQAGSSDWKTNRQNASYTSASMSTSGKQSWQYGRFEMCAKIPISAGMWPAWWTLGVSGEWPSNGEIDIMEYYKGKILANVACGTSTRWTAKWDSATKAVNATWASSFHLWRMDWTATQIDLYVDDTLMNTAKLADMLNADGTSPFMQKVYMIVNLALGGANGGDPAGATFPQTYQIDYVRVYK
jgi:hypothetical protein